MKISRFFQIIHLLMNRERITAAELAERFEVSPRTIYRDIDALSQAGVPLYTTRGRSGGIGLVDSYVLDKSLLSGSEQGEILSALQGLSMIQAADTAGTLSKLSALFNREAEDWLEVDFSGWGYSDDGLFGLLKKGIAERLTVEFDYYGSKGEKSRRRLEPIRLRFKHRAWYVVGYCLNRQEVRTFRLSRIKNLSLAPGVGPSHRRPAAPLTNEPATDLSQQEVTLVLRITPEMAYRAYDEFHPDQIDKNEDGSFTLTVTWPEDHWVYGFILSFGEYARVLAPAGIADRLQAKLKKTLAQYE